jgi:hypothetical protein
MTRKLTPREKNSVDKFNHEGCDPHENRFENQQEQKTPRDSDDEGQFMGDFTRYREGMRVLAQHGLELIPHPKGDLAGHKIYIDCPYTVASTGDGYKPPSDFHWKKKIVPMEHQDTLEDAVNTIKIHCSKQVWEYWKPLVFHNGDNRRPVFNTALLMLAGEQTKRYNSGISLRGGTGGKYIVPQKSWFDPRIQEVTAQDLLSIFPEAERQMFLLLVGRIVVGSGDSTTVEGIDINHKFRSMGIVLGEPGLGKSALMTFVMDALKNCGYDIQTMADNFGRFGWGEIAVSHLAYLDDLTKSTQQKMLHSGLTKQLVSNGVLRTENKGVDAINVKSRTVIIACSNEWNARDLYNADDGIKDRVNMLSIYQETELKKMVGTGLSSGSPDFRTWHHWNYLAKKLNTTTDVLGFWLLHLSSEEFLKVAGYTESVLPRDPKKFPSLSDETYNQMLRMTGATMAQTNPNRLEETIVALHKELRIRTVQNATKDMVHFWRFCMVFSGIDSKSGIGEYYESSANFDDQLAVFFLEAQRAFMGNKGIDLCRYLKSDFEKRGKPKGHPYAIVESVSATGLNNAILKGLELASQHNSPANIIENMLKGLTTTGGYELRRDLSVIVSYYEGSKSYDPLYNQIISDVQDLDDEDVYLGFHKVLTNLAKGFLKLMVD